MENFTANGEFLGQNWGKKEAILLEEAAFIRPLEEGFLVLFINMSNSNRENSVN